MFFFQKGNHIGQMTEFLFVLKGLVYKKEK